MAKTDQQIVTEITEYVDNENCSNWYSGIAAKPRVRLFEDHNVDENANNGGWLFREAVSVEHARSAEAILLDKGFRGGSGGGDNPLFVYAYRITPQTQE